MDELISEYILAFDEINALVAYSFELTEGDENQTQKVADDMLSFLIKAYVMGIKSASEMLSYDIPVNSRDMLEAIYVLIDGKTFEDRVAEHVRNQDVRALQLLAESEYHRVYNTAIKDGGDYYQSSNKDTGTGVSKKWLTMGDNKVRDTHRYLENQTIGLDENFYTYDGDYAPYPGGFQRVENNANCRCVIQLSPSSS